MSKSVPILKIKNEEGQWIDVPAIKGKDGQDGQGTVNYVDGIEPDNSRNVVLQAVRYVSQSLTDAQKNQALANIGAAPTSLTINNKALSSNITLTATDVNAVPNSCTINGVVLTANPTLEDIGAVPTTRTINGQDLSDDIVLTATDINDAVPTSRTINGKALSSNITLSAADISAVPIGRKVNGQTLSQDIQTHITKPNVAVASWASTNTYNDYPYRGTISIPGVTSAMIPNVIFSWDQIESGNFSPIVETDTDAVYIYAESQPTDTVTIPAVICFI